jgi:hypothetical protein
VTKLLAKKVANVTKLLAKKAVNATKKLAPVKKAAKVIKPAPEKKVARVRKVALPTKKLNCMKKYESCVKKRQFLIFPLIISVEQYLSH